MAPVKDGVRFGSCATAWIENVVPAGRNGNGNVTEARPPGQERMGSPSTKTPLSAIVIGKSRISACWTPGIGRHCVAELERPIAQLVLNVPRTWMVTTSFTETETVCGVQVN